MEEQVQEQAKKIFDDHMDSHYRRVDHMFVVLMLIQWLAAILGALILSPKAWVGTMSYTHLHLWAAIFLGGILSLFPILLVWLIPGKTLTRYTIAVAQMLISGLLIHITGGRIETHFHVFGALAFLGFYNDWRVVVPATIVVALDHIIRGIFWPMSVYGVLSASVWRSFEHAGWVLFEDIFIVYSCIYAVKRMREMSLQEAKLKDVNRKIELTVQERTRELTVLNSEIKENHAQLLQAQKLEAIGQLAAGIAHEINTPTQYVGDNTKFLKDSFESVLEVARKAKELSAAMEEGRPVTVAMTLGVKAACEKADMNYLMKEIPNAIGQTLEGVERVSEIVRAMKEFSHPSAQEKTPVDINHALETTITVARNEWKYVADLETSFDEALPRVLCMPGEMNQVFLNLIVNAAQAIGEKLKGEGKGKIRVETKKVGNWAEIRVEDTGGGIPEKIQNKVFDPFFTTKEVGKGSGQGLAIARSVVVEKHQGKLNFESTIGQGTVFAVRLPL